MDFKQNINKIDNELKKLFENVYVAEKIDKGNFYVEITANKMFLFEGCKKRVEVKAHISKPELNKNIINWSYSVNPLDESATKIQKTSYLNRIANDIYDIASNKRMVKEYFNALEAHVDLINEECTPDTFNDPFLTGRGFHPFDSRVEFFSIVSKYGKIVNTSPVAYENWINFDLDQDIKMSDKFRLEKDLMDTGRVAYVSFDEKLVKVSVTK